MSSKPSHGQDFRVQCGADVLTGRVREADGRVNQAQQELDNAAWYEKPFKVSRTSMIYHGSKILT